MLTLTNVGTPLTQGLRAPGEGAPTWSLTQAAEKGGTGISGFDLEDPDAAVTLRGLSSLMADDSDATPQRIFAGFLDERGIGRTDSLRTDGERDWQVAVTDLNILLGDILIQGTGAKRPAETVVSRIMWLEKSGFMYGVGIEPAMIDWSDTTMLPATDYTGRYPKDVLDDISALTGHNFYVFWSEEAFFLAQPPDETTVENNPAAVPTFACVDTTFRVPMAAGTKRYIMVLLEGYGVCVVAYWDIYNTHGGDAVSPWGDLLDPGLSPKAVTLWLSGGTCPNADPAPYTDSVEMGFVQMTDPYGWRIEMDQDHTAPGSSFGFSGDPAAIPPYSRSMISDYFQLTVQGWAPRPGPALAYHPTVWANNTATLRISNDLDDIDGSTTFGPSPNDKPRRDPSRVYSGCYFEHSGPGDHVYVENLTTKSTFFPETTLRPKRDVRASDSNCKTAAHATSLATANLGRSGTEEDRFTLTIDDVPSASVNLVRQGQRIWVKLTHVPGYETGAYMAVMRKTVEPVAYGLYKLVLEVAEPVLTVYRGAGLGGIPHPIAPARWVGSPIATQFPSTSPADAMHGQIISRQLIGTGDGASTSWTLPAPYVPGSLKVWVAGLAQTPTETDPGAGTFELPWSVPPTTSERIEAEWQAE